MSFEGPTNPRSCEIVNNQIHLSYRRMKNGPQFSSNNVCAIMSKILPNIKCPQLTPASHCKRKQGVFFSAPMLTDESVHTARRGGAAARSRSRAGAAVPRSFRRRVYFCCAVYAQLKWQDIIYDRHSKKNIFKVCKWDVMYFKQLPWSSTIS